MIINLGDAPFKAFIKVTYPNGTCTVSLGDKSFTHSGGGTHTFTVNKKGTWTVKATSADGYNLTAQSTAALTYRGQVASVTLSYTLNLFVNGTDNTAVTGGYKRYAGLSSHNGLDPATGMSDEGDYLNLWGAADSVSLMINTVGTVNSIKLQYFNTLKVNYTHKRGGRWKFSVNSVSHALADGNNSINISSITSAAAIKFTVEATSSANTSAGPCNGWIYSMVLTT